MKDIPITNRMVLGVALAFLPAALLAGMSSLALLQHLAFAAAVLAVAIVMFSLRIIGGGVAKMTAAIALWLGLGMPFLVFVIAVSLLAAIWALVFKLAFRPAGEFGVPVLPFMVMAFALAIVQTPFAALVLQHLESLG